MTDARDHIPALDGLRALAALFVLASHLPTPEDSFLFPFSLVGKAFGVCLFFTLSGFLMSYLYVGQAFSSKSIVSYASSRFSRIAPAYLFIVLLSYGLFQGTGVAALYEINNQNLFRHLMFSGNAGTLWSIPPEVQFYVFFPLVWWAADKWRLGNRKAAVPVILTVALMFVFWKSAPGTALPSKLPFFLLGTVFGALRIYRVRLGVNEPLLSFVQFLMLISAAGYSYFLLVAAGEQGWTYHYRWEVVYFSPLEPFLCAVCIFLFSYSTLFSRVIFGNVFMRNLGAWSFSLYLVHEPVIRFVQVFVAPFWPLAAVASLLSVTLSFLMYWAVERPGQRWIKSRIAGCYRCLMPQTRVSAKEVN